MDSTNVAVLTGALTTLISPLIAVQVTRKLDQRRELRDRRFRVFRTLMATRALKLSASHVEALNLIDVEFHGRSPKERAITHAWKAYLDHLSSQGGSESWAARMNDLFIDLLHKMALYFDYDLDPVHLKNQTYVPLAQANLENDEQLLRKAWLAIASGSRPLPVVLSGPASAPLEPTPDAMASATKAPAPSQTR